MTAPRFGRHTSATDDAESTDTAPLPVVLVGAMVRIRGVANMSFDQRRRYNGVHTWHGRRCMDEGAGRVYQVQVATAIL